MITQPLNLISPGLHRTAWRVVRWTATAAVLGAVCGAILGAVFAAFGLLMDLLPSQFVSVAGYFAACGAVAGALVGAIGGVIDDQEIAELNCSPFQEPRPLFLPAVEEASEPVTQPAHLPQHRFTRILSSNRKRSDHLASQDPSRN